MKANFHTHTTRCGHASGTDEDYVRAALAQGFGVLGFSDHVPWPYRSGFRHPGVRMDVSDLPDYERSIRALAKQYEGKLTVALGFECEYFPEYMGWLRDMAAAHNLDYLILGNHYDETDETGIYFGNTRTVQQLTRYVEMTIRGLRTGLFTYLAHPDLFMRRWPHGFTEDCRRAAEDLCSACLELGVPMEYNVHMRYSMGPDSGYPCAPFFEIVRDRGVPVLVGLDAHAPEEIAQPEQWQTACREMEALGIPRLEMPELRGFTGRQ